jgi:hypothetical protein
MAWAFEKEVSAETWNVLLRLAHDADDAGLVVFSHGYLSHLTGVPQGRVEAALAEQMVKGLVKSTSLPDSAAVAEAGHDQALCLQLGNTDHERAVPQEFLDEVNADRARRRAEIGGIL